MRDYPFVYYEAFYDLLYDFYLKNEFGGKKPPKAQEGYSPQLWINKPKGKNKIPVMEFFTRTGISDPCYFHNRFLHLQNNQKGTINKRAYFRALLYINRYDRFCEKPVVDSRLWQSTFKILHEAFIEKHIDKEVRKDVRWSPEKHSDAALENGNHLISEFVKGPALDVVSSENTSAKKTKFLGIVPSRIDDFVGRVENLQRLYEAILSTKKIVFVHGVAGIGKTSLVKVFVDDYGQHFDHIAWINVSTAKDEVRNEEGSDAQFILQNAFEALYISRT